MKISYNWLQNYFEKKLPEPEKLAEGIIFHSFEVEEIEKVGNDTIFEIKVLPDRAHDCLSHFGIAKEISAIFNLEISSAATFLNGLAGVGDPGNRGPEKRLLAEEIKTNLQIEIKDAKCLRYMGRIVRNVKTGKSPDWLKEKLEAIGQKSINNIVDAANFVMFDLGQPIHCFDLDKLTSEKIIIRNAKNGEKITTLDKKEISLDESVLIIADEKDPLAIAGIKGGVKAEVDNNTKNIVIEVANFNPISTRKTSKKIGILTDAVKRYENEITPELCGQTMDEMTNLIIDLAGGNAEEVVDIYPAKPKQNIVLVSMEYINKRLGTDFLKKEIESVWERLGFEYEEEDGEFKILVPFLRLDITGAYDLVEDVIKILGYERIEGKLPGIDQVSKTNNDFYKILWARNKLLNDGYSEVMTYSFRDKGEVEVLASASDKKFLRTNLTDGLKESLKLNQTNAPLLQMNDIKIFEIGTIFKKNEEEMHVAYGDKKGIKEMSLEEFFRKNASPEEHGYFSAEKFLVLAPSRSQGSSEEHSYSKTFKPWSIYPFISRDVAVWMPEGESPEKLKKILKDNGTKLLIQEPYLFDSFTKDGKTSYAFRLIFQSYDRTLKDDRSKWNYDQNN